jgi:thiamine pyrophosphate-dependent acetolactate synthase large subunit-like protein
MDDREPRIKRERPERAGSFPMEWGSDPIAEVLRQLDLEYVSLNPGASYRGLHDSIVNSLGNERPQVLLCNHEEHAVAIAHGYAKVTGRPMGVCLHSNVGLMHATMAIFNTWCDRAPVILLGAVGPVDATRRRPWIDWIHTAKDLGALIRNYTKWDDQPASVAAALESLLRASVIAQTAPRGPVYICLDVALQEAKLEENISIPDLARFRPAPPQEAPKEALRKAAELLCKAEQPLIMAGRVSRGQEDWDRRVRLAEALGARVLTDVKVGAAFPTDHPLHGPGPSARLGAGAISLVRDSDVILSLDWPDLAGTFTQAWGTEDVSAKVIQCSVDCYNHNGWSMDHYGLPPVDIPILAEPDVVVSPLLEAIEKIGGTGASGRRAGWGPAKTVNDPPPAGGAKASRAIGIRDIASCLKEVAGKREVSFLGLPIGWPGDDWAFKGPMDFIGQDGGAGIGSSPGIAVGAALALRGSGRLPVAVMGDGNYLMGVNALWTAAHYHVPLLIIIVNNRSYLNSELHAEKMAKDRGRPVENRWIGTCIDEPPVDLAAMARAQGLKGEGPIADFKDLTGVLGRAIGEVEKGKGCVVDVVVEKAFRPQKK